MPFGISTASEEFQQRLYDALERLEETVCIADYRLIFGEGETLEEAEKNHDKHFWETLQSAREKCLKFNATKFSHCVQTVMYCGHLFTITGL